MVSVQRRDTASGQDFLKNSASPMYAGPAETGNYITSGE